MEKIRLILGLLFILSGIGYATLLEITVDTDKDIYQLNEVVEVYVSLYNPTSEPVTIYTFPPIASYRMDDVYFWHQNKIFPLGSTSFTMQPGEIKTWQLEHGVQENAEYFLSVGIHSVQGLSSGQYSDPAEFQVVPEPATLALLALGGLILRKRKF